MGKIIIKGNFTVESDYNFMNNVKQPLRLLEIEIPEVQPFRVNRFTCAVKQHSENVQKESSE